MLQFKPIFLGQVCLVTDTLYPGNFQACNGLRMHHQINAAALSTGISLLCARVRHLADWFTTDAACTSCLCTELQKNGLHRFSFRPVQCLHVDAQAPRQHARATTSQKCVRCFCSPVCTHAAISVGARHLKRAGKHAQHLMHDSLCCHLQMLHSIMDVWKFLDSLLVLTLQPAPSH